MSEDGATRQDDGKTRESRLGEIRKLEKELVKLKHDLVESAATVEDEMEDGDEATFLLITIAQRLFSIPISYVEEVVQMAEVNPLPEKIWGVIGLIDYHGEMIAVVDLGEIVGFEECQVGADKTMIICTLDEVRFALMVDETTDVVTVTKDDIQVPEEVLPGVLKAIGVLRTSGQAAIIIDVWSIALSIQLGNISDEADLKKEARCSTPAEALRISNPPEPK